METLPISARVFGLQIPLSRIQSLARAVSQVVDDMGVPEEDAHRGFATHITNFANLIFDLALQTSRTLRASRVT